jgi:hypothetical protein
MARLEAATSRRRLLVLRGSPAARTGTILIVRVVVLALYFFQPQDWGSTFIWTSLVSGRTPLIVVLVGGGAVRLLSRENGNWQRLAYVYYDEEPGRAT